MRLGIGVVRLAFQQNNWTMRALLDASPAVPRGLTLEQTGTRIFKWQSLNARPEPTLRLPVGLRNGRMTLTNVATADQPWMRTLAVLLNV